MRERASGPSNHGRTSRDGSQRSGEDTKLATRTTPTSPDGCAAAICNAAAPEKDSASSAKGSPRGSSIGGPTTASGGYEITVGPNAGSSSRRKGSNSAPVPS